MPPLRAWAALAAAVIAGCARPPHDSFVHTQHASWNTLAGTVDGKSALRDQVSAQGQSARGLYFSYPYLLRFGARGVQRTLARARMDAAVLDVKDARGRVSHRTHVKA